MEINWSAVGIAVSVLIAALTALVARDRRIVNQIKNGDDLLHKRINEVRTDTSERFVRRDDLEGHLSRINKNVDDLRGEMRGDRLETIARLDKMIEVVTSK